MRKVTQSLNKLSFFVLVIKGRLESITGFIFKIHIENRDFGGRTWQKLCFFSLSSALLGDVKIDNCPGFPVAYILLYKCLFVSLAFRTDICMEKMLFTIYTDWCMHFLMSSP